METALLKCHKFSCEPEGFSSLVERLSLMVRGIANPVVAAYARMYLIHTVQQGNTNCKCARLDEDVKNFNECRILKLSNLFSSDGLKSKFSTKYFTSKLRRANNNHQV